MSFNRIVITILVQKKISLNGKIETFLTGFPDIYNTNTYYNGNN